MDKALKGHAGLHVQSHVYTEEWESLDVSGLKYSYKFCIQLHAASGVKVNVMHFTCYALAPVQYIAQSGRLNEGSRYVSIYMAQFQLGVTDTCKVSSLNWIVRRTVCHKPNNTVGTTLELCMHVRSEMPRVHEGIGVSVQVLSIRKAAWQVASDTIEVAANGKLTQPQIQKQD